MRPQIKHLDWFIALPLLASLVMIAETDGPREYAATITPLVKGIVVAGLGLILTFCVAAASAIDRRCSEEYMFQIMANAALVAFATTALVNFAWVVIVKVFDIPDLERDNVVGILTLSWAVSYYWFRIKGMAR